MQKRPYFRLGITELELLFKDGNDNLTLLEDLDGELDHRDRPKSKALQRKVKEKIKQLKETASLEVSQLAKPVAFDGDAAHPQTVEAGVLVPARVGVECAHCGAVNFVCTLEGVVQHLSCGACKTPYAAVYKHSVLRATFESQQQARPKRDCARQFVALAVAVAVVLFWWLMKK